MSKILKTWTAIGLATLGTAATATAGVVSLQPAAPSAYILTAGEGGEGGEGGGEGASGTSNTTVYSLNSTDADAFKYDAKPQIKAYADLAYESYEEAIEDAEVMDKAINAFLAKPSEDSLAKARQAWIAARPAYLRTEAFRFYGGPIDEVEGMINAWPLNEAFIDAVKDKPESGLINDTKIKLSEKNVLGRNQKSDEADVTTGWHAIEFLLWGQDFSADGPGNRPYTDYVAGKGNNDRRRAYLKLVAHELVEYLEKVEHAWSPKGKSNYRAAFLKLEQREALGRIINGVAILAGYEMMEERIEVAIDSGDQEDEQSCFSDTTRQDFIEDLVGIKQVWTGDDGKHQRPGLDELAKATHPELASKIDGLLAAASAKLESLTQPWDKTLATPAGSPEKQAGEAAITALKDLGEGFKELGGKLGVLVLIPSE